MNDVQKNMFPQLWLYTSILMMEKKFSFEEALDNIHSSVLECDYSGEYEIFHPLWDLQLEFIDYILFRDQLNFYVFLYSFSNDSTYC